MPGGDRGDAGADWRGGDVSEEVQEPNVLDPSMEAMLKFFAYRHLPASLQNISFHICELAHRMAYTLPPGPELNAGLRKLLEAKDCFVRAALP